MSINSLSTPVIRGEANIFACPVTDTTVESSFYAEYKPTVNIQESDSKVEFRISGSTNQYIDLNDSFLEVIVKVVDSEGNNLKPDAEVSTTNNFLHSMFSRVDIYINNQLISATNTCYPYKAYIETLFSFGKEYLESQGQCFMFHKDTSGGELSSRNSGYNSRKARISSSKPVELIGKLRFDIGAQDRYIINDTNVTISLTKNSDRFTLLYQPPTEDGKPSLNPRVRFLDASFFVRKQVLYPSIALAHQKELQNGNSALYPYTTSEIKPFTISTGNQSFVEENIFLGRVPSRIVIALTSNAGFTGTYGTNPFKFSHFGLNFISVTVNNMPIPVKPMNIDFDNGIYRLPYYIMLNSLGLVSRNEGLILTPDDFSNGNTFFVYDLNQIASSDTLFLLENTGSVRLELQFQNPLVEAVTCVVYSESQAILEIDKFHRATVT